MDIIGHRIDNRDNNKQNKKIMKKDEPDYRVVYTYKLESMRSVEEDFDLVESFAKENGFKLLYEKAIIDINRRTGSVCNLLYNYDKQKK